MGRCIAVLFGVILLIAAGVSPVRAKSMLPGMLYEIDPGLPASGEPLGSSPGIQLDEQGGIVAMKLGSGEVLHRGFGQSTLVPNGLDGKPIISNPAGAQPGGWDSLVFELAAADPIVAQQGQPFTVALVERRRAAVSCDIMKLYGVDDTHVHFSPRANGAILIGQNDGRGVGTEANAEPLNQWDILYYIYDGQHAWLLRNGVRTVMTPDYVGGDFGQDGVGVFEVLNGCAMDVAWMGIAAQAPAMSQINAESARLRAEFPSIVPQHTVTEGRSTATHMVAFVRDSTDDFLITPNNPLRNPLPVVAGASPGSGLAMMPGSRDAFSLVMGSGQAGANMTTSQSIRDRFFLNYMEGDLHKAIGSPMDTGQANNNTFAAVARHFPVGDPNDLHVMLPDGMHLRAICSRDHADCRPGHVWGAMVRLPFEWRPGMTVKVRYRSPKGDHSWAPIWMFTGQQISPGPGGNPYEGFGGPNALYRASVSNTNFEIDWNDNFSRFGNGVPTGYQIDFGTPDIYGTKWKIKPHGVYWANGNGWRYYDRSHNPEFERTPFDWSAGFHDLVGNWRGDGSNLLDLIVDGKLVSTLYMEYPQETYLDPADGKRKQLAMHLIISNQAIPGFSRGTANIAENDGIPDGWTIVVQEISGWYGNIANPDSLRASPENGLGAGQ
jgi:hypothetical protein